MKLGDPDIYVQWSRCENPGDYPTWQSQCGNIQQMAFGENPLFYGFVGKERNPIKHPTSTFSSMRHIVEKEFQKSHHLEWSYDD